MAQSLRAQFVEWVGKQPADAEYDYGDCEACAFAQFLRACGYGDQCRVGDYYWRDNLGVQHPLPDGVADAVQGSWDSGRPVRTFGALAQRLADAA